MSCATLFSILFRPIFFKIFVLPNSFFNSIYLSDSFISFQPKLYFPSLLYQNCSVFLNTEWNIQRQNPWERFRWTPVLRIIELITHYCNMVETIYCDTSVISDYPFIFEDRSYQNGFWKLGFFEFCICSKQNRKEPYKHWAFSVFKLLLLIPSHSPPWRKPPAWSRYVWRWDLKIENRWRDLWYAIS